MNPKRRKRSVRPQLEALEDRLVLDGNVAWYDGVSQYQYNIINVPDIDQFRSEAPPFTPGLPNDGNMYCEPTAAMNWMAYIANHGFADIAPGPGNWQLSGPSHPEYNTMTNALVALGALMGTDPQKGTGDGTLAMQLWLKSPLNFGNFAVYHDAASGNHSPIFTDMALSAIDGNLVMPAVGWYDHAPPVVIQLMKGLFNADISNDLFRYGGHVLSLVQAQSYLANVQSEQMGIHDPASSTDNNLVTQSPFTTDLYNLQEVYGSFGDGYRTQTHVPGMGGGTAYLDEYFAICPVFGLTADADQLIFLKPIQLNGWEKPVIQSFPSANGRRVIDLAIAPGGTRHPYLTEGDDNIWQIDSTTGRSSRLATVDSPQRLVFGGRDQNLFVLQSRGLTRLSRTGAVERHVALDDSLDAIAYDDTRGQLVGVSTASRQLFLFDSDFRLLRRIPLPPAPDGRLTGKISLAVSPTDGAIWVQYDGSPILTRVRQPAGAPPQTDVVVLESAVSPEGLAIDDRGHLFARDGRTLSEYDADGRRVEGSPFAGLASGPVVRILRSFDNYDPETMVGPAYANVLPQEAAAERSNVFRVGDTLVVTGYPDQGSHAIEIVDQGVEGVRVALDGGTAGTFHHVTRVVVSSGPGSDAVRYRLLGGPDTKPVDLYFLQDGDDTYQVDLGRDVGPQPQPWVIQVRAGDRSHAINASISPDDRESVRLSIPVNLTLVGVHRDDTAHVSLHKLTLDAPFAIEARIGMGAPSFSLDNQTTLTANGRLSVSVSPVDLGERHELPPPPAPGRVRDVTALVKVVRGRIRRLKNGRFQQVVTIQNLSGIDLRGALSLVFGGLPRKVKLLGRGGVAAGRTAAGSPYLAVLPAGGPGLRNGETVGIIIIDGRSPQARLPRYALQVLEGDPLSSAYCHPLDFGCIR